MSVITSGRRLRPARSASFWSSVMSSVRRTITTWRNTRASSEQGGVGAAVDRDGGTGDEPGRVGAEKSDGGPEVLRAAELAGRDPGRGGLPVGVQVQQPVGGMRSRLTRIDGDAVAGHL